MPKTEGPGGKKTFVSDIKELRRRARRHMEKGAVTEGYHADRPTVIKLLNEALATEIVCVLRYKRHYFMATGIHAQPVARSSCSTPTRSRGTPTRSRSASCSSAASRTSTRRACSTRSHSEYVEGDDLVDMIREDLVAERIAIDSYAEMIRYVGDDDPTTRRMLEGILAMEEEHAEDLKTMLKTLGQEERSAG